VAAADRAMSDRAKSRLSDEHIRAIGGITVNFEVLKLALAAACWSQIGADERIGQAVTAQLSFRRLCELCEALMDLRVPDDALRAEAHGILARAIHLKGERDRVIHAVLALGDAGDPTGFKVAVARGKGVRFAQEPENLTRLKALASNLKSCSEEVLALLARLAERGLTRSTVLPAR
jgi:hypothetical protein